MGKTGKVVMFMGVGKPLEEHSFPLPEELEPGAILVKTTMATVCGSDMHSWRGRRPFPTPSILGHEGLGTIAQMGSGVEKDTTGKSLAVGDRITWAIMANCGYCCFCRIHSLPQKCLNLFKYGHVKSDVPPYFMGTFGEYVYVKPGTSVFKVPDDMADEEVSPLMCAAATVTAGLARIGLQPGENVVIQGAGMLGLYAAALAKEQGAKQVIMVDILDKRLEVGREFGADHCLNVQGLGDEEVVSQVKDLTDGWGADLVVEVAGFAQVIPVGVKMLRIGGRYLLQGSVYPDDLFTLASHDVIIKCLTIMGLHNYDSRYLGLALDLVHRSRQRYPYRKLTGPEFPLTAAGVTAALESLEKRESIRPIVVP
ncbi:MAG: zinc-binding dehydrogenase [Sedimentisphaerales bacterium]|nr:zinc-binding dehydrogenase [Sedimentisphaerales bacterium]